MTLDDFLTFEKENACEKLHVDDFYYWWYIREEMILQCGCIARAEGRNADDSEKKAVRKERAGTFFRFILAGFQYSPFQKGEKDSLFILQDPTVYNPEEKCYECPQTQFVVQHWTGKKTLISDYYTHYTRNAFPVQFPETTFSVSPVLSRKIKGLFYRITREDRKKKKQIAESVAPVLAHLKEQYNCLIELNGIVALAYRQYLYWKTYYKHFERLILKLKPIGAVEKCYYSARKMVFNEVAKKYQIPVIELQHGVMGWEHRAYNSYIMENGTFPDYELVFSEYWKKCTRIPLPEERIIPVGYPYLEERMQKSRQKKKVGSVQGRILLVIGSSELVDEELKRFLCSVCAYVREKEITDFKILYKMHPGFMRSFDDVCRLFSEYADILHVVRKDEGNLYDCFAIADEQISVISTGLYEGLAYGLRTYVYQSEKYRSSNMEALCRSGYASFVSRPEQLFVRESKTGNAADGLWMKNSGQRLMDTLEAILLRKL